MALVAVVAGAVVLPPAAAGGARGRKPRVVVAVIDSAVNPYHEAYHAGGTLYKGTKPSSVTPAVLDEFGIDKDHIISLTRTGNFFADFAKDKAKFDAIEAGEPYWFKGTNVIGISFEPAGQRLRPDGNESAHGVGTTSAVLAANPEAIVVSVDGISTDSEEWAFTHPAVDIVTTSYGPITSVPTLNHLSFSYTGVVENGKAHFGAAANDPTLAALDETGGPWWSIGVAGFEEGSADGKQLSSGTAPDFVGDFTQDLPYCRNCEEGTESVSGTSFATPRSAGTFSRILLVARRAAGHLGGIRPGKKPVMVDGKKDLTVWHLRRALEEAAYYPKTAEYSPGTGGFDPAAVPTVDQAPWATTGWGLISPEPDLQVIVETLAQIGIGGKPRRSKDQATCDYMTAQMQARHAYWDNAAILGESAGKSKDPYLYC